MKTLIAVPCMDQVPARFAQSLAMLRKVGEVAVAFQIGSLVYTSRNALASRAIQMEADFVLWLDSDMIFEPDLLEHMLDTMEKNEADILTGVYYRRVPPYTPTLFDRLDFIEGICSWTTQREIPKNVFEVAGCGFGCVLMKTDVFIDVQAKFRDMFGPINRVGEDLSFCWRARECGYKIMCDPSIPLGHVGYAVVDRAFYEAYRRASKAKEA